MNLNDKYEQILHIVKDSATCSAHNLDHIMRVYNLCLKLSKYEKDVDMEVLIPAALLHDISRADEDRDETRRTDHAMLGSIVAESILKNINYPEIKIDRIKHCIETHRFRSTTSPETIEAKILFDADKIDSLGAVGIARSYVFAGQFGQDISDLSLDGNENKMAQNNPVNDVKKHTALKEYHYKFKNIPDKLYTENGKEIAKKRLKFMDCYFEQLESELSFDEE